MSAPAFNLQSIYPVASSKRKSMSDKNFGLTEDEFNRMLKALKQGDDSLFEHIYLFHYENCVKYLVKFRGATRDLAYRATMKALLETRKELIQDKLVYNNLNFLFTNKAGKKLGKIRSLKKERMTMSSIEGMDFKDSSSFLEELQTKEINECVSKALQELEQKEIAKAEKLRKAGKKSPLEKCSELLKLHFYENLSYPKIVRIYHSDATDAEVITKADTLSKKVNRTCLKHLKLLLKGCLKGVFDN